MGIIIKQSLKGSIWSYMGLVVGYINVGIIMPNFFKAEQIGLIQLFAAIALIFTNFSTLGFGNVINRLFPEFRNESKKHNGFLFLTVATGLTGFLLSLSAFFIFKPQIIEANIEKSPLLVEYILLLVPLFFFKIFFNLTDILNRVLYDAVTGTFWNDFVHKMLNLILIILFASGVLDFRQFFYGYIISMCLPTFPLLYVILKRKDINLKPNFSFLKKPLAREMIIVAAFGLVNGLSGTLTNNIDKLLINKFLSLEQVGIFSICALFATVIMIPSRAMVKISTGIIAQAWKDNDKTKIQEIYSKASLTQTIIGSLIFAGIMVNLNNIFAILPEVYSQGKWVLIIYSIGILIRVSSSTSGSIILTSKYYKILSLFIVIQIFITLGLHYTFIPKMGITGAAIAVLLTYLIRTFSVVGYIKIKMKMFCYSYKHILVLIIASVSIAAAYFITETGVLIADILIKSTTVSVVFIVLVLSLKISNDIQQIFLKVVKIASDLLK